MFVGLTVGICLAELVARVLTDERMFVPQAQTHGVFQADRENGYVPVLGGTYDEVGCLSNPYSPQEKLGFRLLFVGDSVTHRAKISDAIAELLPEVEVWNAGVEGYDPSQELVFYERYNWKVKPDQIVLTLHNNDFFPTPVAFMDGHQPMVSLPHRAPSELRPWLFLKSHLYRAMVLRVSEEERVAYVKSVDASLEKFRDRAVLEDARFLVLLLPPLKPRAQWKPREEESYAHGLTILQELEIPHLDLLPSLEQALADGVEVQESPGDTWHPSAKVAHYFARAVLDSGQLGP